MSNRLIEGSAERQEPTAEISRLLRQALIAALGGTALSIAVVVSFYVADLPGPGWSVLTLGLLIGPGYFLPAAATLAVALVVVGVLQHLRADIHKDLGDVRPVLRRRLQGKGRLRH